MKILADGRAATTIGLFGVVVILSSGCDPARGDNDATPAKPGDDSVGHVTLRIELPTPNENIVVTVEHAAGMTVVDLLHRASEIDRRVGLKYQGHGETAFVHELAGVANRGAAGDNWIFHVNGKLGDRSAGARQLVAGDLVVWKFGQYP